MENIDDFRPGVLNNKQIKILGEKEKIINLKNDENIDFSSFDLHIRKECYLMEKGGIKPLFDEEYQRIKKYIANNPNNWTNDNGRTRNY